MKSLLIVVTILFSLTSFAHDTDIDITQYADAFTQLPNGDVLIEYPNVKTSSKVFYFSHTSDFNKLCEVVFGFKSGFDVYTNAPSCFGSDLLGGGSKDSHYVVDSTGKMRLDSQEYLDTGDSCNLPKHRYVKQITCSNN